MGNSALMILSFGLTYWLTPLNPGNPVEYVVSCGEGPPTFRRSSGLGFYTLSPLFPSKSFL